MHILANMVRKTYQSSSLGTWPSLRPITGMALVNAAFLYLRKQQLSASIKLLVVSQGTIILTKLEKKSYHIAYILLQGDIQSDDLLCIGLGRWI